MIGEGASNPVFESLRRHYEDQPERVCLVLQHAVQPDRPITYREFFQAAAGYERAYAQSGIQPGEVVILILQHGMDLIAAFWGAVLRGAIPSIMPFLTEKLLPDRYRKDLASLFAVTCPAAVVTYPEFEEEVRAAIGEGDSTVRVVLLCSEVQPEPEPDFSCMEGGRRDAGVILLLQHSSGTTGLQKGVAISYRALMNQLDSYRHAIRLTGEDVIVSWLPLYHDMGLIAGFLMPLLSGVPLVLLSPFDWVKAPYRLMRAVTDYRGTLTWLPNFAYNFCAQKIRDAQLEGVDLSSWRAVINCSEPMYFESFRLFYERFKAYGLREGVLATSYAMAENVFGVTQGGIDDPVTVDEVDVISLQRDRAALPPVEGQPTVKMLSCGKPIPGTEVRVLDEQGNPLPERRVGELAVRSNCMLTGYYNRPDLTEKAFIDGWYLTGDYGYIAEGEVYVTGRKKDLIIVGGRNIFPQDLEALANEVPGVHPGRVVVFGLENPTTGTEEVALVAEVDLTEEQFNDPEIRQNLEDQIRLAVNRGSAVSLKYIKLVRLHWIVKTSSGKMSRAASREKYIEEADS